MPLEKLCLRLVLLTLGVTAAAPGVADAARKRQASPTLSPHAEGPLGLQSLWFEPNVGQFDPRVQFLARAEGFDVLVTSSEIVLSLREVEEPLEAEEAHPLARLRQLRKNEAVAIRIRLKGGHLSGQAVALERLGGVSHYLIGNDPTEWRTHVPHYARVELPDVYPGISLVLRGNGRRLEYDIVVAPGADPSAVDIEFVGGRGVSLGPEGEFVLKMRRGELHHSLPVAYQEGRRGKKLVPVRLSRRGEASVSFEVPDYDRSRPLVIDPELVYLTPLGGSQTDIAFAVATDASGHAYITGFTNSPEFPTTANSYQPLRSRPGFLAFVTKFSPEGALVYSTYLGGSVSDGGFGIAVDADGNACVTGTTSSADFPVVNGFQATYRGGIGENGFVAQLNPGGSELLYSSFLGGSGDGGGFGDDIGLAATLDAESNIHLAGLTNSADFPTKNAFQAAKGGSFDGFVMTVNPALSGPDSLLYSSFLGGGGVDEAQAIVVDPAGNIHLAGRTRSADFPIARPLSDRLSSIQDAFVSKLNPFLPGPQQLVYSTYLGGNDHDEASGLALDASGRIYLAGTTFSTDFPITPNGRPDPDYVPSPHRNFSDAFFAKLDPAIAGPEGLLYSSYLGGSGRDTGVAVGLDDAGNIYVGGTTQSPDFPTARGTTQRAPFVVALQSNFLPLYAMSLSDPASQRLRGMAVGSDGSVYLAGDGITTSVDLFVAKIPGLPRDEILLLSTTTRWKAQRDTATNIEIDFTSSKPLESATVNVTGPVTVEPVQATFDPNNPPNPYKLTWSGLDSSGNPLPAGDYKINIVGQPASGVPISSSPADHVVSLVEVSEIKLMDPSGCVGRDTNPLGPGHGDAIFAEAKGPNDPVCDRIQVEARIEPPIADPGPQGPVQVYFRSFDVDDPSAEGTPIDDPSFSEDNRGLPHAGLLVNRDGNEVDGGGGVAIPASGSTASSVLRVSRRQGDNYRVVASTSQQWLGTLTAPGNRTDGAVLDGTTALPEGQQVTPLLTVWRTLFLQTARMPSPPVAQTAWEHQATAVCPTPPCIQGNTLVDTNGIPHPDHQALPNVWMGADLDVTPATPRTDKHIVRNSTAASLFALTPLAPFDPAFNYALWDDEVASLAIGAHLDDSLAESILQEAFIRIQRVPGVHPPAFRRNLEHHHVAALPTSNASSDDHWTAPIVLAFEGDAQGEDGDPSTEDSIFGLSNGLPGAEARQPRIAIYTETIRDYSETPLGPPFAPANRVPRDEVQANTVAHEILHLFGLVHDGTASQGGMMCARVYVDADQPNRTKVTPSQLEGLRKATELKIRRGDFSCP